LQRAVGKSWVNNHTHVLSAVKPLNNDLLEVLLRKTNIGHIVTGAVQPKINQTSLKSLEIALPKSGLENLAEQVKMLLDKRLCNRNQIQNLSEIRDNLLPKLMSGQVRVKDL
jgi:type I restriction enzyme S subunit